MPSVKANHEAIKALVCPAGKERERFVVEGVAGLSVRVRSSGAKAFFLRYQIRDASGKRVFHERPLGPIPPLMLAQAKDHATRLMARVRLERTDPLAPPPPTPPPADRLTVDALFGRWRDEHGRVKLRRWEAEEELYRRHAQRTLGHRAASEVTRAEARAVTEEVATHGGIAANRLLARMRAVWNWGMTLDLVEVNPWHRLPTLATEHPRERELSETELRAIWRALVGNPPCDRSMAILLQLAILLGQRPIELVRARKADLHEEAGLLAWTIPSRSAKSKKPQRVPLPPLSTALWREAIALSPEASPFVFPGRGAPGRPIDAKAPTHAMRKLLDTLGIEDARLYDARKTVGSQLPRLGTPESTVSRVLSHAQTGVTARHYMAYDFLREKLEALGLWEYELLRIVALPSSDS